MAIEANAVLVVESAHMNWSNDDGSVTIPAGEEVTLVEYDPVQASYDSAFIHAIGASDAQGLEYRFKVGEEIKFSTQSPLGTLADPFSFTESMGHALGVNQWVEYTAVNTSDTEINAVGRMFVEES